MEKIISGKAFVLGNNIDTDQIIPAEHLVYSLTDPEEAKKYGHFALSGVPQTHSGLPQGNIPFIEGQKNESNYTIIIAGVNFGCGSSREHAPFALQKAGVKAIIAESYARIFYRNAVDGGFLIPLEAQNKINNSITTGDELSIDLQQQLLTDLTTNKTYHLRPQGDVLPIIDAGGLFAYARKNGMIRE
jgi:3-isopropylmalate/(R)-2-methylmalate dehydratase small subunit